jgi:hypothetical protein
MADEYTHVVEAKGAKGDWKPMTKHVGAADANKAMQNIQDNPKTNVKNYRVVPFGSKPAAKPAVKKETPVAKPAAKKTAPATKPAAKKAAPAKKK